MDNHQEYFLRQTDGPTYNQYPDKGCNVSPSCFDCPLARCKHDDPAQYRQWLSNLKDSQAYQSRMQGAMIHVIAEQLGITERTVFRQLARHTVYLDEKERN